MADELKTREESELKEYEKRSLIVRSAVALGTLLISGITGYLAGRLRRR